MRFPLFNRGLLPAMLAGSVMLTGYACSRPDRAESGSNDSSTVVPDSNRSAMQPTTADTARGAMTDTAVPADSGRSAAPKTPVQSNSPRAETAAPSGSDAAGYRPMDRDTGSIPEQHGDSARVTADSAETSDSASTQVGVTPDTAIGADAASAVDTAAVGYIEMARDTSTVADQADTAAVATSGDVALQTSTDSSSVDADTEPITDSSVAVSVSPDTTDNAGPGNVTSADDLAFETADEQIVTPDDQEKVAASEAPRDEIGAAAVANGITGAEALMGREGVRCAVIDPETNEAVRWDMSSTPVTLNPCGMGSMNLSKIWTTR